MFSAIVIEMVPALVWRQGPARTHLTRSVWVEAQANNVPCRAQVEKWQKFQFHSIILSLVLVWRLNVKF